MEAMLGDVAYGGHVTNGLDLHAVKSLAKFVHSEQMKVVILLHLMNHFFLSFFFFLLSFFLFLLCFFFLRLMFLLQFVRLFNMMHVY